MYLTYTSSYVFLTYTVVRSKMWTWTSLALVKPGVCLGQERDKHSITRYNALLMTDPELFNVLLVTELIFKLMAHS